MGNFHFWGDVNPHREVSTPQKNLNPRELFTAWEFRPLLRVTLGIVFGLVMHNANFVMHNENVGMHNFYTCDPIDSILFHFGVLVRWSKL